MCWLAATAAGENLCDFINGTELVVPAGTTAIAIHAFDGCQSAAWRVTYVYLPKSVAIIESGEVRGYGSNIPVRSAFSYVNGPKIVETIEFEAGSALSIV